ncbi:hypothetical protein [Pseudacidobacterium ailaaui]|jgi:hypothetical protein|uniref:hypothetical protein n=1 Tax=Pseudacidobacterium ailaaui TaxID=1382359 RepID=UPI00047C2BF8|nr:hypothetical protein [Pseudacidobacterium ailaaui]
MSLDAEQLYALLPAVYRTRDAAAGGQLQSLFAVMAQQAAIIEDNIEQLYDDQFIETCAPWVVSYIGDLIGYNSIYDVAAANIASRAEVANTIGYRRRKGTLIALEQVAKDVSGRESVAVEYFHRLITTESMRHVRSHHAATVNLRYEDQIEKLNTAFDTQSRTTDVRRIAPRNRVVSDPNTTPLEIALHGPGRFNIPDIGIWLWRWQSWQITNAEAFPLGKGRYMFSALGQNIPLFSRPTVRASFSRLTTRMDVPQPVTRREFGKDPRAFYGSSMELFADGQPLPLSQIVCCNLSAWTATPAGKISIDPELGRIQFADDLLRPQSLRLNYCYGFPAPLGGGPYDRSASLPRLNPMKLPFLCVVGSQETPTLEAAIALWNQQAPGTTGLIILPNFESFTIDLTGTNAIQIPEGGQLSIVAAETHTVAPQDVTFANSRTTLSGNITVNAASTGQLVLSGLWIAGQLSITGSAASVQLMDCTFVPGLALNTDGEPRAPGEPSIFIHAVNTILSLTRCISGPIAAAPGGSTRICSSIVDSTSPCCVAYAGSDLASPGADLHIEDSTIIGKVHTRTMSMASNTIFYARLARRDPWPAPIWCSRQQTGCMRFCFVPANSITPRRYKCLPADADSEAALKPQFITRRYGDPSYMLLSGRTPLAIWQGADNGSQIGAYNQIQETEAVRNVQLRAPEYLPFGLESGIFLIPSRPLAEHPLPPTPSYYGPQRAMTCCEDEAEEHGFTGIGANLI